MILLLATLCWLTPSGTLYVKSISPSGVRDIPDFFYKLGDPSYVKLVEQNGRFYYEFLGCSPRVRSYYIASNSPRYVFDGQGKFIEWCSGLREGEVYDFEKRWPWPTNGSVSVMSVKQKFGIGIPQNK